jgi:hypothetical protein
LKFQDAIRIKQPGQLARVLLHHEFKNYSGNRPYSLDLAPNDFHLFGPPKNHCSGKHFAADDEEVEMELWKWLRQQSKDFNAAGFSAL